MKQLTPREQAWHRAARGPLLVLSLVFIVSYSFLVLDQELKAGWVTLLFGLLVICWLSFLVDYVVRLVIAPDRRYFFWHNILDLVTVLIPLLRPVVELTRVQSVPYFQRRSGNSERVRLISIAVAFVITFIYTISLAEYAVERDAPGANITTFGDSLWWAFVTLFTVGYGDKFPVTTDGRILAVSLMLVGLGIIGVATAVVGSYLTERVRTHSGRTADKGSEADVSE